MSSSTIPKLAMRHVSKSFPGVRALTDISLEAYAGETLCLDSSEVGGPGRP